MTDVGTEIPLPVRFWAKVEKTDACWHWTGTKTRNGYGILWHEGSRWLAHRLAYTSLVGKIPDGQTIDHLCRTRDCVNPLHLEPVTHRENVLRGEGIAARRSRQTHCSNGHEFTDDNTYRYPNGRRACRQCRQQERRRHYEATRT